MPGLTGARTLFPRILVQPHARLLDCAFPAIFFADLDVLW